MKRQTGSKKRKWPLVARIGIVVLLLVLVAGIIINLYLNQFIAKHLSNSIKNGSKGLYSLTFQNVSANVFARQIHVKQAELHIDSAVLKKMLTEFTVPPYLVEGHFPSVSLSHIHILKLIFSNSLVAGELSIQSPDIEITELKITNDSFKLTAKS